jgi:three-Cys-motif partner protein
MAINQEFFHGKKAAAVLKHGILTRYVPPFVEKTGSTAANGRVVVLDGYSGPGEYEDGSPGSPLLMVQSLARSRRTLDLLLVEQDRETFERLVEVLQRQGLKLPHGPYHGRVEDRLDELLKVAAGAPLFAFLDPYGLGITFDDIVSKIFARPSGPGEPATEVLLNFSADAVRRIGGLLESGESAPGRDKTLARLDAVVGGDWWRDVYAAAGSPEAASEAIAERYLHELCAAAKTAGWVAEVRRAPGHQPIYSLVYLTRHRDGMALFGESLSLAQADWRKAVAESGTLDDEEFHLESERALTEEWHDEILRNLRRLLAERSSIQLGRDAAEVYGSALGYARETHLRKALKVLHRACEIVTEPKGSLWKLTVTRAN